MLDALGWARDLATAGDAAAVGRILATACHSTKVWVAPIDEAREVPAGRLALARGAPLVQRSHDLPEPLGGRPASPMWLLAVPDGQPQTRRIAFLARSGSLRSPRRRWRGSTRRWPCTALSDGTARGAPGGSP